MRISKQLILIFVLACLSMAAPSYAHALGVISFVGLGDTSNIAATGKKIGAQTGYGGGLLLGFPLAKRLSLETGALYFNRNWSDTTSGSNSFSSQVLQVPVLLKVHLILLSLGAGAYYSSNVNNLSETGSANTSVTYGVYGINSYDYGLMGDVGFHIPVARGFLIKLDGQYLSSLTNSSSVSGNTFQYRDVRFLAGFTFLFGDLNPRR